MNWIIYLDWSKINEHTFQKRKKNPKKKNMVKTKNLTIELPFFLAKRSLYLIQE